MLFTPNDESEWRSKIGLSSADDARPPAERNVYLRRLKTLVEERMLYFIRTEGEDPESEALRSPIWTPIPWVCENLEISAACLSRLLRELTGLNAIQTYYVLKLKTTNVPLQYIALIKEYVAETLAPRPAPLAPLPYSGNGSLHFWKWLKEKRHNPDFNRQLLAREFNFPSGARFHRAFYFATGSTPREFENLVIRLAMENSPELATLIEKYSPNATAPEPEQLCIVQKIPLAQPEKNHASCAPDSRLPIPDSLPLQYTSGTKISFGTGCLT